MNYLTPERLDKLAAEYVLGTLRGLARKRFERVLAEHATARAYLREWEERLARLALAVPEIEPPRRVWRAIEARLAAERPRRVAAPRRALAWWRGLALGMGAVAAAALITVGVLPPREGEPGNSYVVVLAGDNLKPVILAEADRRTGAIQVRLLTHQNIDTRHALELWGIPQNGKPRSYGLIPTSGVVRLKPGRPIDEVLRDISALAVSLEPQGGSPTGQPTGPVLYTGTVVQPI